MHSLLNYESAETVQESIKVLKLVIQKATEKAAERLKGNAPKKKVNQKVTNFFAKGKYFIKIKENKIWQQYSNRKKIYTELDKIYKLSSLTAVLDGNPELAKEGANAGELLIAKLSMQGLADYNKNTGYVNEVCNF